MRKTLRILTALGVGSFGLLAWVFYPSPAAAVTFPGGKRFAFSIVDDTDLTTLERVKPLYDLMAEVGLRTTKTVWVLDSTEQSVDTDRGASLRDQEYRQFVLDLKRKGFEIALHGVRGGSSPREDIVRGLNEFNRELGGYPNLQVNHAINRDNIYWGAHRWSIPIYRWGFSMMSPFEFSGHEPSSVHFWGDLAKQHIQYMRRFTFHELNLLKVNRVMPYRVDGMPYANFWFDASDGGSINAFEELLKPENLDRLEREGGVAVVYAHLGAGSFNRGSGVHPQFESRIRDVAARNGWFAPVSEILDHLRRQPGWSPELSFRQRVRLETLSVLELIR